MDAQQFLAEFGYIASAPGGIQRLRELILQLAICGKLVELSAVVQPVADSITLASQLRSEYEAELKLRATRAHPPITIAPFAIPKHWQWERLEQLSLYIQRGKGPKYVDCSTTHVVSQKCVQWSGFNIKPARFIADDSRKAYSKERFLKAGDLLWNSTGTGTAGRVAIYDQPEEIQAVADSHVTVIRLAKFLPRYIWCVIASSWIQSRIEPTHTNSLVSGTTQQVELSTSAVRDLPIPCPPLEEQIRIVAKVDELMALCNNLEDQQQAIRTIQNNLRLTSLQAVANTLSPNELNSAWQKVFSIFSSLFSKAEDVSDLRNLVLELAVHGLLVEQNQSEETAAQWLARVKKHRHDLLKAKQIAKQSPLSPVTEDEHPFSLPKGWTYVRLGEIINKIGSGSTPRGGREVYVKEGIPFLRSQNVRNDGLKLDDAAYITVEEHERMSNTAVQANDILLNITGASLGRSALVPSDFSEANVSQHVTIIRLTDPEVRFYLHLCILSPYAQAMIWGRQVGMAREGLSKKVLEQFEIPLPPVAEQRRIVKRVAELMRLCDVLERELYESNNLAQKLALASISVVTGIHNEEEDALKTPKTELISKLRLVNIPSIKEQAPLAAILARHHNEMPAGDLLQRYGGDIDAFYAQLKLEVGKGWIEETAIAEMRETEMG